MADVLCAEPPLNPNLQRFVRALVALCGPDVPMPTALGRVAECVEQFVRHGATADEILRLRRLTKGAFTNESSEEARRAA